MDDLQFDAHGLIPAIVQHARSGEVLMLGYMNADALQHTRTSGLVTFWSRSRGTLWIKGETSGNTLQLVSVRRDCDADTLLVLAEPTGPTCHTGRPSCFAWDLDGTDVPERTPATIVLTRLADLIATRATAAPDTSYTAKLLAGGVDRIGKKIGEEAAEVIIAAKNQNAAELTWELTDLLYHALVLMQQQQLPVESVLRELERRELQ